VAEVDGEQVGGAARTRMLARVDDPADPEAKSLEIVRRGRG
jgi:hypothetical protein